MKTQENIFGKVQKDDQNPFVAIANNRSTSTHIFAAKSQPGSESSNQIVNVFLPSPSSDIFSPLKIHCKCNKPVMLYCCSENCVQNAVMCLNSKSPCMIGHKGCTTTMIADHFHEKIQSKLIKGNEERAKSTIQKIQKIVDQMMDEVSEMVEKLEKKFELFGLNSNEIDLYEKISKQAKNSENESLQAKDELAWMKKGSQTLTGKSFHEFNQKNKPSQKINIESSFDYYKQVINSTKQAVARYFVRIENALEGLVATKPQQVTKSFNNIFKDSRIVSSDKIFKDNALKASIELNRLQKICKERLDIDSLEKLYFYSTQSKVILATNQANIQDFMQAIIGKRNLLFLVDTHDKRRIGCFWSSGLLVQKDKTEDQQSFNSFIFDLESDLSQQIAETYQVETEVQYPNIKFGLKADGLNIEKIKGNYANFCLQYSAQHSYSPIKTSFLMTEKCLQEKRVREMKQSNIFMKKDSNKSQSSELIQSPKTQFPIMFCSKVKELEVFEVKMVRKAEKQVNQVKKTNIFMANAMVFEQKKAELEAQQRKQ